MCVDPTLTFKADLWPHSAGSWVFVTVPRDDSDEIRDVAPDPGGFGSVRVQVTVGETDWRTSVFPDAKSRCFVLPIKKQVRAAEHLDVGDTATVRLTVLMQ